MGTIGDSSIQNALVYMEQARDLLLEHVRNPEDCCQNIAESLDLLNNAYNFAANPYQFVPACPQCGGTNNEPKGHGYSCLDCDHPWVPGDTL